MKRYRTLFKETWWLWIAFTAFAIFFSLAISPVFLVTFPICIFTFFWFGFIRFDKEGKLKGS